MTKSSISLIAPELINFLEKISQVFGWANLALEGGAALILGYNIHRQFSGDLDFTCSSVGSLNEFIKFCRNYALMNKYKFKLFSKTNRVGQVVLTGPHKIQIDIWVANPLQCDYETKLLKIHQPVLIRFHSKADLLAEKMCCLIDPNRTKLADLSDTIALSELAAISHVKNLFTLKAKAKSLSMTTINDFFQLIPSIESRFIIKYPQHETEIKSGLHRLV